MKKLLMLAVLALGLVACGEKAEEVAKEETPQVEQAEEAMLTFTREDGEGEVVVKSMDNFETATITVGGEEYSAMRAESADGVKVATEDGKISVHFKGSEGVLEMDGTNTVLSEVK